MARIFISYSRVDKPFTEGFAKRLNRMFPDVEIWWDDNLHGGDVWWQEILDQIAACDVFIYLLSNESVQSPYCQAEFTEARRRQKRIITVQVRDRTQLTDELGDIQYVDMKAGCDDAEAVTRLSGAVRWQLSKAAVNKAQPRPVNAPEIDTPVLSDPSPITPLPPSKRPHTAYWAVSAVVIVALAVIEVLLLMNGGEDKNKGTATAVTRVALATKTLEPTSAITLTPTMTASATSTLSPTEEEGTIQALMDQALTENALTAEAAERLTQAAITAPAETEAARLTATATLWTLTPTPDLRETANARLTATQNTLIEQATQQAATLTQAWIGSWTDTPTSTFTPTFTPTPIPARSVNKQVWPEPVIQSFDGVEMVYVPAGCFMMGSDDENDNEKPAHEVCLDAFWMDRTEVTNAQYKLCVEAGACTPPGDRTHYDDPQRADHPIIYVDWNQATDYAAWIGGNLPTEAQWEYAARGPEGFTYPWGNKIATCDLANIDTCVGSTSQVGSNLTGASWVEAMDLSGNVWEWTADWYGSYPSQKEQNPIGPVSGDGRVVRGGSWYDSQSYARATFRGWDYPESRNLSFGFRVVRVPPL